MSESRLRTLLGRLLSRKLLPRYLFGAACLATGIALFYTVENWRGKRAWERCRRDLEAQGVRLDWADYIPPPVPDDLNTFKAPNMAEWFVRNWRGAIRAGGTNAKFVVSAKPGGPCSPSPVARVTVGSADATVAPEAADIVVEYRHSVPRSADKAKRAEFKRVIQKGFWPLTTNSGPRLTGALNNITLVAGPTYPVPPLQVFVRADNMPGTNEIAALFPYGVFTMVLPGADPLRVEPEGTSSFKVFPARPPAYTAADYLACSGVLEADFDAVRQALKRPYARMDGDYQWPFDSPIPNFVAIRCIVQILSQRAQCYLLLEQPESALRELTLVHDVCRLLEARPANKPITLVSAMIEVAVAGLYANILADGLRLRAWHEPQLAALQAQLEDTRLIALGFEAFESERVMACYSVEALPRAELAKLLSLDSSSSGLWQQLRNSRSLFALFAPRGWLYQNMTALAMRDQEVLGCLDLTNQLMLPGKVDRLGRDLLGTPERLSPYNFLTRIATPNFTRAFQTLAHNQTTVNQAFVACALERYRLAEGRFPETLDALVPRFAGKLPHDIITGQPLKYRRSDDDKFTLYSVGWDEKDDGGVPGKTITEGDWVWQAK